MKESMERVDTILRMPVKLRDEVTERAREMGLTRNAYILVMLQKGMKSA